MLKVILATGFERLDNSLLKRYKGFPDFHLFERPIYYREGLSDMIERTGADVVLISDYLDGASLSQDQLIKLIRKKHPNVRIVYLLNDEKNVELQKFLFTLGIYDVLPLLPKLNTKELERLVIHGNQWKDVSHFFSDYDPSDRFKLNEEFLFSTDNKPTYKSYTPRTKQKSVSNAENYTAFWSPRGQSGSTTLLSNAAIMLAQREEERVFIIDFNVTNPNLHLTLGVEDLDGNHNLSALCEDLTEGSFQSIDSLSDYLLTHSVYENVSILPGFILKYATPSDDILLKTIHTIFKYAKTQNYTSIAFDMDNDLSKSYNIEILKMVTKILMPLTERPGTIVNLQKIFDTEFGPFYLNFLDVNKIHPVLNFSTQTVETKKITQIIENLLSVRMTSVIPYTRDIAISTNEGVPFLKEKPSLSLFRDFVKVTNCVHDVFVVPPVIETKRSNGGLFGRKK